MGTREQYLDLLDEIGGATKIPAKKRSADDFAVLIEQHQRAAALARALGHEGCRKFHDTSVQLYEQQAAGVGLDLSDLLNKRSCLLMANVGLMIRQ